MNKVTNIPLTLNDQKILTVKKFLPGNSSSRRQILLLIFTVTRICFSLSQQWIISDNSWPWVMEESQFLKTEIIGHQLAAYSRQVDELIFNWYLLINARNSTPMNVNALHHIRASSSVQGGLMVFGHFTRWSQISHKRKSQSTATTSPSASAANAIF